MVPLLPKTRIPFPEHSTVSTLHNYRSLTHLLAVFQHDNFSPKNTHIWHCCKNVSLGTAKLNDVDTQSIGWDSKNSVTDRGTVDPGLTIEKYYKLSSAVTTADEVHKRSNVEFATTAYCITGTCLLWCHERQERVILFITYRSLPPQPRRPPLFSWSNHEHTYNWNPFI